ncbi:hypothetical protein [Quisquiliibacterium transsilvanicum]|uniref:Uncharacterized protein n=1 Tax=Quisquiliibacterium transsilvanicum TaxID=1549638 RepID=A0A7W8HJA8_9BURK|nr:hypothetical protein [Quisquiliibacterium transsilvanicum]MBB5272228.1 hypothetical protein [Quisquiliibacterium transsilvanicum]
MEFIQYDELAKRERELPDWIVAQYRLHPMNAKAYLQLDYWTPEEAAALVLGFHPVAVKEHHDPAYLQKLAENGDAIRAEMNPDDFLVWVEINNVLKLGGYRGVLMNFRRHWEYRGQRYISPLEWVQRANALEARLPTTIEDWFKSIESGSRTGDTGQPSRRAETTYLNIIGGLIGLMLGKSPGGQPLSVYDSQAAIIAALLAHHEGKPGMSERSLEQKFAAAKRSLTGT